MALFNDGGPRQVDADPVDDQPAGGEAQEAGVDDRAVAPGRSYVFGAGAGDVDDHAGVGVGPDVQLAPLEATVQQGVPVKLRGGGDGAGVPDELINLALEGCPVLVHQPVVGGLDAQFAHALQDGVVLLQGTPAVRTSEMPPWALRMA